MENKQKIIDEINKTKEHLSNLEKMLEKYEYERWKPNSCDPYYYIDAFGNVLSQIKSEHYSDNAFWENYNCFQTREQAEQEAEKILVRRQLEDIARRLNKGRKIDWSNEDQTKSFIFLDCKTQLIERDGNLRNKIQGVVYCLDNNFRKIAIQEIGEERLIKYLRGK